MNKRLIAFSTLLILVLAMGFGCDAVNSSKTPVSQASASSSLSVAESTSSSSQSQVQSQQTSSSSVVSSSKKVVPGSSSAHTKTSPATNIGVSGKKIPKTDESQNKKTNPNIGDNNTDGCTSSSRAVQKEQESEKLDISEFANKIKELEAKDIKNITFFVIATNLFNTADPTTSAISVSEILKFIQTVAADTNNTTEIPFSDVYQKDAVRLSIFLNNKTYGIDAYLHKDYINIMIRGNKSTVKYKLTEEQIKYADTIWEYANQGKVRANPKTAKPVIYLYPTVPTNVNVQLNFIGKLTYTYPQYNNGWQVTAYPDGTLTNLNDNTTHCYLFWEGNANKNWQFDSGFLVKGENAEKFLKEKLAYMGLTPKEYNDFIVYWVPKMQDNKYNLISFSTKQYEEIAKLNITPKPDSMLRVHMLWKNIDEPVTVKEETLQPFERKGFTVVEWGGTELKQ